MLFLEWDEAQRPEGGKLLLRSCSGPLSISHKEPAGVAFQNAILRKAGLLGEKDAQNRQHLPSMEALQSLQKLYRRIVSDTIAIKLSLILICHALSPMSGPPKGSSDDGQSEVSDSTDPASPMSRTASAADLDQPPPG